MNSNARPRFAGIGSAVLVWSAGVRFPNPDRPVDILYTDFAAILEANVYPITHAFVDDR